MRVDVVVAYHEPTQRQWWDYMMWGLDKNSARLDRVLVVNDGKWQDPPTAPSHVHFLEHGKEGFGLSRSLNLGFARCDTEFVLVIEGDEILAPGSVERTLQLAKPDHLLCALKRYIDPETAHHVLDGGLPVFIEEDHRRKMNPQPERRWSLCSGGHLLVARSGHEQIGGFDEHYEYGLHDYDYAARWMRRFGDQTVVWSTELGEVWHIGSGKGREAPPPQSWDRLARTLMPLYSPLSRKW